MMKAISRTVFIALSLYIGALATPAWAQLTPGGPNGGYPGGIVQPQGGGTGINNGTNTLTLGTSTKVLSNGLLQGADQLPQITDRPPTDLDGANVGLNSGALWRWKQLLYQAQTSTLGDPEWLLQNSASGPGSPLPCDAATVAAYACLALKQARSGYTGPLLVAQGADATTYTVQQLADGSPDVASLQAALGNDLPIRVEEVFDQSTGGACPATQSTAAYQPLLLIGKKGELIVVFDEYDASAGDTTFTRFLTLPSGCALTKNTISAYNISELHSLSLQTTYPINLLQIGSGSQNGLQLVNYYNTGVTIYGDGIGPTVSGGWHSAAPMISWMITSTTNRTAGAEGFTPYTKTGNLGAGSLTGGTIGMTSATSYFAASDTETVWRGTLIYNSTLSTANDLAVREAMSIGFKTRPQANCNVVMAGESVAAGVNAPGNQAWFKLLQDSLPAGARLFDQGIAGQGVSPNGESGASSMASLYSTMIAPIYNANARCNIAILFPGVNDGWAASPNTTTDEYNNGILAWVADAKATGFNPVFVATDIDRQTTGTAPQQAAQAAYLAAMSPLITNGAAANGYQVLPFQSIAELGAVGASSNTQCFPDGIHPVGNCLPSAAAVARAGIAPYVVP